MGTIPSCFNSIPYFSAIPEPFNKRVRGTLNDFLDLPGFRIGGKRHCTGLSLAWHNSWKTVTIEFSARTNRPLLRCMTFRTLVGRKSLMFGHLMPVYACSSRGIVPVVPPRRVVEVNHKIAVV